MKKRKDKYKVENADMCMRCERTYVTPKGNGLRWVICSDCAKELKKLRGHYEKHGLYLTHFLPQAQKKEG